MQRLCAWCGESLGGGPVDTARPLSHGICETCMAAFLADVGVSLTDFLAELDVPVLLVDGKFEVQGGSPSAPQMTGMATEDIHGKLGGDVFECANASLPGGCGRTIHCSGCVLRQAVTETYRTGRSHTRVPATLRVEPGATPRDAALFVTTERVGDRVLLQIEPA